MLTTVLGSAIALVLVIEGLLPSLSPSLYRRAMRAMSETPDSHLRLIGLSSMIAGAVLLTLLH